MDKHLWLSLLRLVDEGSAEELQACPVFIWSNGAKDVVSGRFEAPREGLLVGTIEQDRPHVGPLERFAPAIDDFKSLA